MNKQRDWLVMVTLPAANGELPQRSLRCIQCRPMHPRNAPSVGTEGIDRIGKSPSGLGNAITSSSKSDVLVILTSQIKLRCMMSPHICTFTWTLDCAECGP